MIPCPTFHATSSPPRSPTPNVAHQTVLICKKDHHFVANTKRSEETMGYGMGRPEG
ncbi:DNA ligase (NAD+) [Anopheles sinensis]|uniref:DNA ligase (NAD+) n=1 Tax=Anopheles sinensis TaxID=74873 RepID=A0A084VCG1_ANOSI|nr:DNA ligase (NAD+) [Anopheles sinensis]